MKKKSNNEKIDNEIKFTEIFVSILIIIASIIGIILSSIGISKYEKIGILSAGDLDNGILGLVTGILSLLTISYLLFEVFFNDHVYGLELSLRGILLIVAIFMALASIIFGSLSFVNTKQINYFLFF